MIDTSAFQGKTAAYFTLGCKLNFSETSTFAKMLQEYGVVTAKKGEQADICLINTCSVTEVADRKCRQVIHRMVRNHPGAFVVVTGCYAQLKAEDVSGIEGVDLVLGSDEKARLIQYLSEAWSGERQKCFFTQKTKDIKSFAPSCSRGNRTRYFLKVQDGCDYFCTYCTIPYARGFSRNPTIASLVAQAEEAASEGGKEIVLTGVNIGDFGKTTGERFVDLVKALDGVEGISRYRISSLEPDLLSDELIEFCAKSRAFMPHFHIPLQSGSDTVLKLMHRHYDAQLFADKIHRIKALMPDAFIGVCSHIPSVLARRHSASRMLFLTRRRSCVRSGCWTCRTGRLRVSIVSISGRRLRCSSRRRLVAGRCMASRETISGWNCRPSRLTRSWTIS